MTSLVVYSSPKKINQHPRPWKENQGKSMINSRFQTIEMVWLFNKMPQDQQRSLAAGLLKFAKSMSDWSAAHAKLT